MVIYFVLSVAAVYDKPNEPQGVSAFNFMGNLSKEYFKVDAREVFLYVGLKTLFTSAELGEAVTALMSPFSLTASVGIEDKDFFK